MLSQNSRGSGGSDVLAPAARLHPGVSAAIEGFTILATLPEAGAQADLYLAEGEDKQRYALKLYRSFTRPSTAVAQLVSGLPGSRLSIPLYQGEWEGRAFEVSHYFPGGNLAGFIKKNGPLGTEQALRLLSQMTEGLEQLHRIGVQHRDLKPTNILVRSQAPLDLALADFGLAAISDVTVLSQPYGTLFYTAPEALTGMHSRAGDFWSLGIVLIEALTGDPIVATLRNDGLLHYRLVQGKVPIPETIPPGWQPLLKGLLERDHYRRWQAVEVRSWLEQETGRIGVTAEKKARPFLLAFLALALAMTIGAGLYLEPLAPAPIQLLGNTAARKPDSNLDRKLPAEPGVHPDQVSRVTGVDRDTRTGSFTVLALIATTVTALAWVLATIFFLIGITHALNGAPHGAVTVLLGIFLALGAYFLPRLWA
jgi:serine/threonine protein kinase